MEVKKNNASDFVLKLLGCVNEEDIKLFLKILNGNNTLTLNERGLLRLSATYKIDAIKAYRELKRYNNNY